MQFKKGDLVRWSAEGLKELRPINPRDRGTVIGKPRAHKDCVTVEWDQRRTASSYHISFIKPEKTNTSREQKAFALLRDIEMLIRIKHRWVHKTIKKILKDSPHE